MKKLILTCACLLGVAGSQVGNAVSYTGSLNGGVGGGLVTTDGWTSSSTSLSWTVQDIGTVGGFVLWQYDYTFTVPTKNISHFIIEVSPDAGANDFTYLDGSGELGTYTSGGSNPNMPSSVKGIKFGVNNSLSATVSFTTTRSPVWGDFYAKDGKDKGIEVTAWNSGFTSPDTDPIADPSSGSVDFHILRPDTKTTRVPDGGTTACLLGLGMLGLSFLARRKA